MAGAGRLPRPGSRPCSAVRCGPTPLRPCGGPAVAAGWERLRSGRCPRERQGRLKGREVIRMLEAHGWRLVVTRGSHRQFKHPARPGRVTVSGGLGDQMPKGTLGSVLRQAGLRGGGREET